jgi:hypothetical protein
MHHSALGRGAHDNVAFDWEHYRTAHEFVWTSPLARNLLPDGPTAAKPWTLRGNCGLAGTEIYVNSLGDVYPCKLVTDKPHHAGNIRDRPLAELYDSGRGEFETLNSTAAAIWRLADAGRTLAEMAAEPADAHGAGDDAQRRRIHADVREVVDELTARGILTPDPVADDASAR